MKMKRIILILLLFPVICSAQYRSETDSITYMKKVYTDYHIVNNSEGCLLATGTFTSVGSLMLGAILATQLRKDNKSLETGLVVGGVITGTILIALSIKLRKKHNHKYKRYKQHYAS